MIPGPPGMPPSFGVPAKCTRCGLVFRSDAYSTSGHATAMTFKGNLAPCKKPGCPGPAKIIDGTFDFLQDAILVRNAPPETLEILRVLQDALKEAQAGEPDDVVLARIEKASPAAAGALQKVIRTGGLSLAIVLTGLLSSCSSALNWNQVIDQVYYYATGSEPYFEQRTVVEPPPKAPQPRAGKLARKAEEPRRRERPFPKTPGGRTKGKS